MATPSASPAASKPPRYEVIPLGGPVSDVTGFEDFMQPWRMNNKGEIVGSSGRGFFLYQRGGVYYLGSVPQPLETRSLLGINDHGVIVGVAQDVSSEYPGNAASFVLRRSSPTRDLNLANALILPFPALITWDINNQGTIVGEVEGAHARRTAVVYEHGRLTELPGLVPAGDNFAVGINNRGQIVGTAEGTSRYRPVIWSKGRVQDLGLLPGFSTAYGTAINDHGDVAGWCGNPLPSVGFIYTNGVMSLLQARAEAEFFEPTHINNAGEVLVWFFSSRTRPSETFLLYSDGALYDLGPIVADATGWPILGLTLADMNDHGDIIGTAQYDDGHGTWVNQGILLRRE